MQYRRAFQPGGMFFFTLVSYRRRPMFRRAIARSILRNAIRETQRRRPSVIDAMVLLPEHLHTIWTLPEGDADFSTRWRKINESFTRAFLASGGEGFDVTPGQSRKRHAGVWQARFWEHMIRDDCDYRRHVDYIHYNPVRHGLASCPHKWQWSSFSNWVKSGV